MENLKGKRERFFRNIVTNTRDIAQLMEIRKGCSLRNLTET
jgi:hypothetical protein